jgi:hypothetical protein
MAARKSTGKPAGSLTPALITLHRQIQLHLKPTVERLRLAQAAITTSAVVLRQQNADCDADVARVLLYCAAEPLDREIERIEALMETLGGQTVRSPVDKFTYQGEV